MNPSALPLVEARAVGAEEHLGLAQPTGVVQRVQHQPGAQAPAAPSWHHPERGIGSAGDLHLKCEGRLTLEALGGATLKSSSDVDVQGLNVRFQAQIDFAGHGATTAEVTSAGLTTVNGALVLVN